MNKRNKFSCSQRSVESRLRQPILISFICDLVPPTCRSHPLSALSNQVDHWLTPVLTDSSFPRQLQVLQAPQSNALPP